MFIDLDNFKQINDTYGHATGDAVLIQVSWRLQEVVRTVDTVARLGGDEFVVVCEDVDHELAVELGHRLREAIRSPLNVDGVQHESSASIGIALSFQDPQGVLADADVAVYRAKAHGGDCVEMFG
jgi:diguanylate cyclase (GGDEF)-like protein